VDPHTKGEIKPFKLLPKGKRDVQLSEGDELARAEDNTEVRRSALGNGAVPLRGLPESIGNSGPISVQFVSQALHSNSALVQVRATLAVRGTDVKPHTVKVTMVAQVESPNGSKMMSVLHKKETAVLLSALNGHTAEVEFRMKKQRTTELKDARFIELRVMAVEEATDTRIFETTRLGM